MLKEEDGKMLELDFGEMPEKLKEYLDIYNGNQSEIISTTQFDKNSDLSATYLYRVDTTRASMIKAEETFPISEQGYTVGKLLDGTTYLYRVDKTRASMIKAEATFPISGQGYTVGKLLDGTECQVLLDTGASKSFMSNSHYLHCKSLHSLPKFASKTQRIQVGNGQFVTVLFIIPMVVDIHGHRFEIYTSVSEIHENVDLVLGIKDIFELEGIINS